MRKIYALLGCALLALPAMAEDPQLPNNGFEDGWGACTPWTSKGNTATQGQTPAGWTISQVIGTGTLGKTTVGENVAGYESASAVKVYNVAAVMNQKIPGYFTLGTTWSTSVGTNQKDGGTFGGLSFTGRPQKIEFMYKFERKTSNSQPANAIAYLWKGTFEQANVPGNIVMVGNPTSVNMVNRDRNILGMSTTKGGEVTKKGTLIAKGTTVITEATSEWTKGEIVFEYLTDDTPEMINIIFAANDYFGEPSAIVADNSLTVDNVLCTYTGEVPPEPQPEGDKYTGKLVVEMDADGSGFSEITNPGGDDASIYINKTSDNSCSFLLPNLTLPRINEEPIGDIFVENVTMTTNDGVTTYTGHVNDMSLLEGAIHAEVDINGTTDASGKASMIIDVVWKVDETTTIPIKCTFNGQLDTTGIDGITVDNDENAPVELYNLNGVRVNAENATPGLYIRRQGNKVTKTIIR